MQGQAHLHTGSVNEMFAKMQGTQGNGFRYHLLRHRFDGVEQRLIQPLDKSLLPNRASMISVFKQQSALELEGKLWACRMPGFASPEQWASYSQRASRKRAHTPPAQLRRRVALAGLLPVLMGRGGGGYIVRSAPRWASGLLDKNETPAFAG